MGPPKDKFAYQTLAMFAKVVENSSIMVKKFNKLMFYWRKLTFKWIV
jgi:hypothetical protein